MTNTVIEESSALRSLLNEYISLPLGGKKIRCPYWVNRIRLGRIGPYGGKGTPTQIIEASNNCAKKEKVNFDILSEKEIINFLVKNRIGIDCSGFVFWMLDVLDKEKGGNGMLGKIPNSQGRFLQARTNTKTLFREDVTRPVLKINEIKIGDLIRLRGGTHVAIIISIERNKNVDKIVYTHSSSLTAINGVHEASINIVDINLPLGKQIWSENAKNNNNYGKESFWEDKGDGVRRLCAWE